jgi:integrase
MSTTPDGKRTRRARRSEPITKRVAKNGAVGWEFRCDVGVKADGNRDRRRFTFRTLAEARREYRRISSEVAKGTYVRQLDVTVDEAIDQWLKGRRGIRPVTLTSYRDALKPVCKRLGGRKLQEITKRDGDELVAWMLSEGRQSVRHYQPESLPSRVTALIGEHPEGISAASIATAFPGRDVHTCLSGLVAAGRVTRVRRGVYVAAEPAETDAPACGVKPVTVRTTLTVFTMMVQSFVDEGRLARNPIALVERPTDEHDDGPVAKSWTVTQIEAFRDSVRDERLFACWLLSCYGLRRSEILGLKWSDINGEVLSIRRGRVAVGNTTVEGRPKSQRSRRDLPMPAELTEALRMLKTRQKKEALALGVTWSDDRLIAVHEDGTPVRPEWYSDEFHRLREHAGLRRIKLHGLRNTSVSLMLDVGHPVHVVARWHGHSPTMALAVYSEAKADELRAASTALFRNEGAS